MNRIALAGFVAASLAGLPVVALAVPSEAEVSSARATCHSHKLNVRAAESQLGPDHPALPEKRLAWERSCQQAQLLMDARAHNQPVRTVVRSGTSTRSSAEFAAAEQRRALQPCDSADPTVY